MAETAMKLRGFHPEAQQPEQQGKTFGDRLKDLRQKVGGLFGRGSNIDILEPGASVGATPQGEELHHEPSIHVPGGVKGLGLPPEDAGQNVMDTNVTTEAGTLFNGSGEEPDHELEPEENREEQDEAAQAAPDVVSTEAIVGQQSTEATGEEGLKTMEVGGHPATMESSSVALNAAVGAGIFGEQPLRVGAQQPPISTVGQEASQAAQDTGVLAEAATHPRRGTGPLLQPGSAAPSPSRQPERPPHEAEHLVKWIKNHPKTAALMMTATLAVSVVAGRLGIFRPDSQSKEPEASVPGIVLLDPSKTPDRNPSRPPATATSSPTEQPATQPPATKTVEAPQIKQPEYADNIITQDEVVNVNGVDFHFQLGIDPSAEHKVAGLTINESWTPTEGTDNARERLAKTVWEQYRQAAAKQGVAVPGNIDAYIQGLASGADYSFELQTRDPKGGIDIQRVDPRKGIQLVSTWQSGQAGIEVNGRVIQHWPLVKDGMLVLEVQTDDHAEETAASALNIQRTRNAEVADGLFFLPALAQHRKNDPDRMPSTSQLGVLLDISDTRVGEAMYTPRVGGVLNFQMK